MTFQIRYLGLILLVLVALAVTACGERVVLIQPASTLVPLPTYTPYPPLPTYTPLPTFVAATPRTALTPRPTLTPIPSASFGLTPAKWDDYLYEIDIYKDMVYNALNPCAFMSDLAKQVCNEREEEYRHQYTIESVNPQSPWYVGRILAETNNPLSVNYYYEAYLKSRFESQLRWSDVGWRRFVNTSVDNLASSSDESHILLTKEFFLAVITNYSIVKQWIILETYSKPHISPTMKRGLKKGQNRRIDSWMLENPGASLFNTWLNGHCWGYCD